MKVKYKVTIGNKSINVIVDDTYNSFVDGMGAIVLDSDKFDVGCTNYRGREGIAVNKAIIKLFGKNSFWSGSRDYDGDYYGKVLKESKNYITYSLTSLVDLNVEKI